MATKAVPYQDLVVIRPENEDTITQTGIHIPSTTKEEYPCVGVVVEMGPDVDLEKFPGLAIGARVLFTKFGGDEVEIDNVMHRVVRSENVLCELKKVD